MNVTQKAFTILVVDDVVFNVDIVRAILQKDDSYIVHEASSGSMALDIIDSNEPDLILLDTIMPEMDGYEVCKQIKASDKTKNIPVIFLTSDNEVLSESKGFEVGAVDYITKPFDSTILLSRVKCHLKLKYEIELLKSYNKTLEEKVQELTIK